MSCTCRTLDDVRLEVCLAVGDVTIHREVFVRPEDAARFALAKLSEYSAE